jgi:hydrogenase nickel incorporation protein HypA/HybF
VHELALSQAIADTTVRHARGRPVSTVHVRVGHLRQVVPDSLVFCWQLLTDDSELAGAELQIDEVPAVVRCSACGEESTLAAPVLACLACGSFDVALQTGDELLIEAIEVLGV